MNSSARVTSVQALERFRVAMEVFDDDARNAIAALTLEVRRVLEWIEQDRTKYWPRELRRAFDRVAQARNDLERCLLRSADGNARSCWDEKKALERAKRRVRTCEEKIQQVKYWRRQLRHDVEEFTAQLSKLESHLDVDWTRGVAAMKRMVHSLEKYAEVHGTGGPADESGPSRVSSQAEGDAVKPADPPMKRPPDAQAGPPAKPSVEADSPRNAEEP